MAVSISRSEFLTTLDTTYTVVSVEPPVTLKLIEVSQLKDRGDFEFFSLFFEGSGGVSLVQKIYRLTHDQLGDQDIFLVPVAPDSSRGTKSFYYQASFSRKKNSAL